MLLVLWTLEIPAQTAPSLLPGAAWTSILPRQPAPPVVGIFRPEGWLTAGWGLCPYERTVSPPLVWDGVGFERKGQDCQPGSCIRTLAPGQAVGRGGPACHCPAWLTDYH